MHINEHPEWTVKYPAIDGIAIPATSKTVVEDFGGRDEPFSVSVAEKPAIRPDIVKLLELDVLKFDS